MTSVTNTRIRDWVGQHGSPLLVLDCLQLQTQYQRLAAALPAVALHYAIKALPHPAVIETLAALGANFDLASSGEIELLRTLNISPQRTIHTHPIKRDSDIRDALNFGCTTFVVDNIDELQKFIPYKQRVELLLRLSFRSTDAVVDLSKKFGCPIEQAPFLLSMAKQLELPIKGLSFHVGSQCRSPSAHVAAIRACAELIAESYRGERSPLQILDIGGGFPVAYHKHSEIPSLEAFCAPIRKALAELPKTLTVIAEPGRVIAAPAMTAISSVIGKAKRLDRTWYYLDDGVYGSFSGQIYDHARYPITTLPAAGERYASVLAGPTCDSIDIITEDILLPDLLIGDLVIAQMMGAYTLASASEFNSLPKPKVIVHNKPVAIDWSTEKAVVNA